jgi:ankyrin repeat protein
VNRLNAFNETLSEAVHRRDQNAVRTLSTNELFKAAFSDRMPDLMVFAAISHQYATVEVFLDHDPTLLNQTTSYGMSPLSAAVSFGDPKMTKQLLERGADCFQINSAYSTAARLGVRKGRSECVELVLLNVKEQNALESYRSWENELHKLREARFSFTPNDLEIEETATFKELSNAMVAVENSHP